MQVRFGELIKLYSNKRLVNKSRKPVSLNEAKWAQEKLDSFISKDQNKGQVQEQTPNPGSNTSQYSRLINNQITKGNTDYTDYYLLTNGPLCNTLDDYEEHIYADRNNTSSTFLEAYTITHQMFFKSGKNKVNTPVSKPNSENSKKHYANYGYNLIRNHANSPDLVQAFSSMSSHFGEMNQGFAWIKAPAGTYQWLDNWRHDKGIEIE